jgi:hypothetical protein
MTGFYKCGAKCLQRGTDYSLYKVDYVSFLKGCFNLIIVSLLNKNINIKSVHFVGSCYVHSYVKNVNFAGCFLTNLTVENQLLAFRSGAGGCGNPLLTVIQQKNTAVKKYKIYLKSYLHSLCGIRIYITYWSNSLSKKPTDALNSNFIVITALHVSGSLYVHHHEFLADIGFGTFYAFPSYFW